MIKTGLSSDCVQDLFDSASNAARKGQAQYFTPKEVIEEIQLPSIRTVLCDLTAGDGGFLKGAANRTTRHLIGAEIQRLPAPRTEGARTNIVTADVTALYPLLQEVGWQCDLFLLNPPWDLHWYKERLFELADSEVLAVRDAFKERDPRLAEGEIDSMVATLCIALDRCTQRGEGVILANQATAVRLVTGESAPHGALAQHVWRHDILRQQGWAAGADVAVLYFARDHETGNAARRHGLAVESDWHTEHEKTIALWNAVSAEWQEARQANGQPAYHLSLAPDDTVHVHLSDFVAASHKTDKALAKELISLKGQRPMQLVVSRGTRTILQRALEHWTVDPALQMAVEKAVAAYQSERAPLSALSKVQRLGYLEEEDFIRCEKDFGPFRAGQTYRLTTQTIEVKRRGKRVNLVGAEEELEFTGQQLATHIRTPDEDTHSFLDASCLAPGVTLGGFREGIVHTLQELLDHFHIPEVPDVAAANPERFRQFLKDLETIEQTIASLPG